VLAAGFDARELLRLENLAVRAGAGTVMCFVRLRIVAMSTAIPEANSWR